MSNIPFHVKENFSILKEKFIIKKKKKKTLQANIIYYTET